MIIIIFHLFSLFTYISYLKEKEDYNLLILINTFIVSLLIYLFINSLIFIINIFIINLIIDKFISNFLIMNIMKISN